MSPNDALREENGNGVGEQQYPCSAPPWSRKRFLDLRLSGLESIPFGRHTD